MYWDDSSVNGFRYRGVAASGGGVYRFGWILFRVGGRLTL
jgi:hypothetical protein